ncbi:SWI/SNF complex subunit SWI3C-like [Salvia divinorum]|uniref:SWI/SNF complex subunit SWI3C-like n=1 Tax=Salvia divinorum TaxID=28513 RepID=A0ABD1IHH7_SALDI
MQLLFTTYSCRECYQPQKEVAFLASALGPRVAAACAHVSLGSLSKESSTEGSPGGYLSQHDAEGATLSGEKVISAAEDGLTAAAMKATLFADHEEREIQWLSANIIDHQDLDDMNIEIMRNTLFTRHTSRISTGFARNTVEPLQRLLCLTSWCFEADKRAVNIRYNSRDKFQV